MRNDGTGRAGRERSSIATSALLLLVLAMLMVFAAITLRWGLAPAATVTMTVALGAAATRIVRGTIR